MQLLNILIHDVRFVFEVFIIFLLVVLITIVVIVVFVLVVKFLLLFFILRLADCIELCENILDLLGQLLVTLSSQVFQHLLHSHLPGQSPKLLSSKDTVQSSVYVGPDHEVFMFHEFRQNCEHLVTLVLAHILALHSKAQVHQESSRILKTVL